MPFCVYFHFSWHFNTLEYYVIIQYTVLSTIWRYLLEKIKCKKNVSDNVRISTKKIYIKAMPFNINTQTIICLLYTFANATQRNLWRVSFNIESILFTIPSRRFDYHSLFFYILFIQNIYKSSTKYWLHASGLLCFKRVEKIQKSSLTLFLFWHSKEFHY